MVKRAAKKEDTDTRGTRKVRGAPKVRGTRKVCSTRKVLVGLSPSEKKAGARRKAARTRKTRTRETGIHSGMNQTPEKLRTVTLRIDQTTEHNEERNG